MELLCAVQEYAWGKKGESSQVAKFAEKACSPFTLEDETPYAELWMGIHPNGPSRIAETGKSLADFIGSDPECLGEKMRAKFGDQLPYLFKVLSVNKALSIQAHPNKFHAELLHKERPDIYKDPNHKPEIAVALTDFEGLCGFRPLEEIQTFMRNVPELPEVIGAPVDSLLGANKDNYQSSLRDCFESLMVASKELIASQLTSLTNRLSFESETDSLSSLLLRLHSQYPGDVGCFVIYFLNYISLKPGEAMFLGPNIAHAYLSGDCIECMANSDNVVRAGLTPKLIDTPTLVEMLDYTCSQAESRKFTPVSGQVSGCLEFDPPVPDFSVAQYTVPGDADNFTLVKRDSASIIIVVEGSGKYLASHEVTKEGGLTVVKPFASADIKAGSVIFLPADKAMEVFPEDCETLVLYQAYCNL